MYQIAICTFTNFQRFSMNEEKLHTKKIKLG